MDTLKKQWKAEQDRRRKGRINALLLGLLATCITAGTVLAGSIDLSAPGFTTAQAQTATGWSSNGTTTTTTQIVSVGNTYHSTVISGQTAYDSTAGAYTCYDTAGSACWRVTGGNGSAALAFFGTTVSAANWAVGPTNSIGAMAFSATAPTITSACTTPTVTHGTATSFQVDVGGACATGTIVLGLPAATNGWICVGYNKTTTASAIRQTADTTTSATMVNYTVVGGVSANFVNGDDLAIKCTAR